MQLTLKDPVLHGSETVVVLDVRETITAKDLRGLKITELDLTDNLLKLAGRLCVQPDSVMDRLSFRDLIALFEALSVFLEVGPKTGSAGSA
jgi:hypothetical protein